MAGKEAAAHFPIVVLVSQLGAGKCQVKQCQGTSDWIGYRREASLYKISVHTCKRGDRKSEKLRGEVAGKQRKKNKEKRRRERSERAKCTANNAIPLPMEGRRRKSEVFAKPPEKVRPISSFILRSSCSRASFPSFLSFYVFVLRGNGSKCDRDYPPVCQFSRINLIDSSNRATFVKSADTSGLIVTIIFDECLIDCSMMLYIAFLYFIVIL